MFVGLIGEAIGFLFQMKQLTNKMRTRLKIVGATATAVFSLASVFTATLAWFASNQNVTASAGSISIQAEKGISFDLYYLHHFAVDQSTTKDGNYNAGIDAFAGYENAYTNPVFTKVNYDSNGNVTDASDPTDINHLWPAHKLTYAIVITDGSLNSFSLFSWSEVRLPTVITQVNSEDVEVSLSWAINMYGGAYYVASTATVTDDIATGFAGYNTDLGNGTLTDKFTYSQTNIAPETKTSINIANSISGTAGNDKRVVLYFSIEFSNDSSTFYTYQNPYYVKDSLGNSNCYEKLSLTNLIFRIA